MKKKLLLASVLLLLIACDDDQPVNNSKPDEKKSEINVSIEKIRTNESLIIRTHSIVYNQFGSIIYDKYHDDTTSNLPNESKKFYERTIHDDVNDEDIDIDTTISVPVDYNIYFSVKK